AAGGKRHVAYTTAQRRPSRTLNTAGGVIMRRIAPGYTAWLAAAPSTMTRRESFCAKFLTSEYQRARTLAVEDELKDAMEKKLLVYERLDQYSSNEDRIAEALNELVSSINAVVDAWDTTVVAGAPDEYANDEARRRHQRKRRAGVKQFVG